ncbi:MAG: DUF3568 family protein [Planctomycetota bacterium]
MTWKRCKRIAPAAVLAVTLTLVPGCGVELAVIGAAASAASQGAAVYSRGKLIASWMGPFDLVVAAAEIALGDLGYVILESSGDANDGAWTVVGIDEDGDKVTITVDRKTQQLTEFKIDVTWFGQEATARLILKRMAVAIDLKAYQDGTGNIVPAPAYVPPAPDAAPESETDTKESETAKEHTPDHPAAESDAPGKAS